MPQATNTPIYDLAAQMISDGMPVPAVLDAIREAELGKRRDLSAEFDAFWRIYPARIGKGDAEKSFQRARKQASLAVLLDGVMRYAAKRDDRPWCNPATWLNQKRWLDEEPAPPRISSGSELFFQSAQDDLDGHHGNGSSEGHHRTPLERLPLFAIEDHSGHR